MPHYPPIQIPHAGRIQGKALKQAESGWKNVQLSLIGREVGFILGPVFLAFIRRMQNAQASIIFICTSVRPIIICIGRRSSSNNTVRLTVINKWYSFRSQILWWGLTAICKHNTLSAYSRFTMLVHVSNTALLICGKMSQYVYKLEYVYAA